VTPRKTTRTRRPITAEGLLALRLPMPGALSADGRTFVFPVKTARDDRKGYDRHLYVLSPADGELRRFTHGPKRSDSAPVISPDGSLIAFLSKRARHPGIHLIPTGGGEARPLVERDGNFAALSFSPDGRKLLCTFQPNDPIEGTKKGREGEDPDASEPKREPPVLRHIERLFYRMDGAGFLPREEPQVWVYDLASGKGTQVTRGKRGALQPSFSPDGRWIAFVRNIQPDPDRNIELTDLFVVPATGGRPRRIPTPPGPAGSPTFSPDGRWIAYLGHDDLEALWYEHARVWVVPVRGAGRTPARCLCPRFDQPSHDATITDCAESMGAIAPYWSRDARAIFFLSSHHGATRLYRLPASGGTPRPVTPDRMHLQSIAIRPDGRAAAGVASTATMPPEVFTFDLRTGRARRMTSLNRSWTDAVELRAPERIRVRSTESTTVDAWILKPPGFRPTRRYPAILEVHGGPQTQYGYSFFHELQLLAARGYVVVYGNPRGSEGYGRAFAEAIRGDWGNRDFTDVMALTDKIEELSYVDSRRIGITGGSYGGYMTNWAVGHTRRYKAAVTQRSVVDLTPFYGSSDIGFLFQHTFGTKPWEDPEGYQHQSPLTYARRIRTPLLIIHSENDMRCSIEQAENLFATLKMLGRRVAFVRFPGEPHGLSRGGRPDRRLARLERILDWFARYL
jgi:dipeptidyl aminopeptidase/acylaminoacyl peptidase